MRFEEIFKQPGLYVHNSCAEGVCFEVDKEGWLYVVEYADKDDINPDKSIAGVNKNMFRYNYEKVYTRQSLFTKESK